MDPKRKSRFEAGFSSTEWINKVQDFAVTRDEPPRCRAYSRPGIVEARRPNKPKIFAELESSFRLRKALRAGCSPERTILPADSRPAGCEQERGTRCESLSWGQGK